MQDIKRAVLRIKSVEGVDLDCARAISAQGIDDAEMVRVRGDVQEEKSIIWKFVLIYYACLKMGLEIEGSESYPGCLVLKHMFFDFHEKSQ